MHPICVAIIETGMSMSVLSGVQVNWIEAGPANGETVVLLHPVGWDLTYWDRQIDALRKTYRVVALDLPGHGRSGGSPADCSFARMVEVVSALIEQASAEPVHLAGISFGSMLAQEVVLARPQLVRSLVLMGTACAFSEPARQGMRARAKVAREQGMAALVPPSLERWFASRTLRERPDLIDRVTKTVLSDDPQVHAAVWDAISHFETQNRLGEIACPALVLVGELDPSTTPEAAEAVRAGVRGAKMLVFPGVSHMIQVEAPDEVNTALLGFLQEQLAESNA